MFAGKYNTHRISVIINTIITLHGYGSEEDIFYSVSVVVSVFDPIAFFLQPNSFRISLLNWLFVTVVLFQYCLSTFTLNPFQFNLEFGTTHRVGLCVIHPEQVSPVNE